MATKRPRPSTMVSSIDLVSDRIAEPKSDSDTKPKQKLLVNNIKLDEQSETKTERNYNSKIRKKKRKKAIKMQEQLLSSAKEALFTGSVVVDLPPDNSTPSTSDSIIEVTTNSVLPKTVQLQKLRMFNVDRPSKIFHQPLLVLDINGILCHRIRSHKEPQSDTKIAYRPGPCLIAGTPVIPRPDLANFLSYLDAHFCLAVWTSAKPKTAKQLIQALFPAPVAKRLLFVWGQNRCKVVQEDDTEEETVFVKELDKVWKEFPLFNRYNTLLLDDSPEKCPFQQNALHPFPLHGQKQPPSSFSSSTMSTKWISDEDNHSGQLGFFHKLVGFWERNDVTASWDELGEVRYNAQSEEVWTFLGHHATEKMGWRRDSASTVDPCLPE